MEPVSYTHLDVYKRQGEEIAIPIDMRFDIKGNANRWYQKYHKSKRAQSILKEQIALCRCV